MKASDAYPSTYVKAADLQGRKMRLTIKSVEMKSVSRDEPDKPVMSFDGAEKSMVLNRTNFNTLVDLYGDESDDWIGKPIVLYPTKVDYQGKRVDALRLEAPAALPNGKGKQAKKPDPEPEPPPDIDDSDIPF